MPKKNKKKIGLKLKNIYTEFEKIIKEITSHTNQTIFSIDYITYLYENFCYENKIPKNTILFKKYMCEHYSQYNLRSKNIIKI